MSDAHENSQQANPQSTQKKTFAACLKKCQLHSSEMIAGWLSDHDQEKDTELASKLVRDGHLTRWQAKYLLSGRHRLHLGNYQLLERIRRDEFGDRFIALHPNLGRQVLIQILPVELTDDEQRRGDFLRRAGRVGELDHPNLAHVFDIDRDQGRYFLVTEHAAGQLLNERTEESLEAMEIGRIVRDTIMGLRHAHAQELTHGQVSPQSLLVTDSGTTKVTRMALSPLVQAPSATPQTVAEARALSPAQEDLAAAIEIGQSLAQQSVAVGDRSKLDSMLSALGESIEDADGFERAFIELDEWADSNTAPIVIDAGRSDELPEADAASVSLQTPEPPPHVIAESNGASASTAPSEGAANTETKHDPSGRLPTVWLLLGISAMSLLIGGVGVASFFWLTDDRVASETTTPGSIAQQKPVVQASVDPQPAPKPKSLPPTPPKIDDAAAISMRKSEFPTPEAQVETPTQPSLTSLKKPNAQVQDPALPSLKSEPKPSIAVPAPTRLSSEVVRKPPTKKKKTTQDKTASPTPAADPEKPAEPQAEPFDRLPAAINLPPIDSLADTVLATIPIRSNYLLGAELIAPTGIARGKTVFKLVRDKKMKQRWHLNVKRSSKAKGRRIGNLSYLSNKQKLQFRWTDDAADSKQANYVRNAALKLTVANESRTLSLRQPLKITGLKITRKKMQPRVELPLEHLPQSEMITVELLPWKAAGLPKSWLEPSIVRPGQPAAIHFHEAVSNQFCWLRLDSDIRTKVNLNLQLLLKHADGSVVPIESTKQLKLLASSIQEAARGYEREYEAQQDYVAPKGKKTKFKTYLAKVKSNMTKAKKQTDIAIQNVEILSSVYGRPIPLRILFRSGDHRLVLADTILTE